MPEEIYNSIKKNLIEIGDHSLWNGWQPDVEDELTNLENKINGVSTMNVEPTFYKDKDELKDELKDEAEEEFPFNFPDNKEGLEKVRRKIKTNKEYKNAFKNWGRIASEDDIEIFNLLSEKVDKILNKILSGGEDIPLDIQEKIIKRYKVFVSHVIKSQEKNDETIKFESSISPLYSLSLKEKTIYIKELISER